MKNKLNSSKILVLVSLLILIVFSCKKDTSIENPLNEAKEWYLKLSANSKTAIESNNENIAIITKKILWDKSQIYKFNDGKEVVGTPVKLTLGNKKDADGSYMLLIFKIDDVYNSQIIYNEKNDYFSNSTSSDVEAAFLITQKNNKIKSLAKSKEALSKTSKEKVMRTEVAEDICVDWYLIETITYSDGQIAVYETYLYTICSTSGNGPGGGGGGSNDQDQNCSDANQESEVVTISQNISSLVETTSAETRTKIYKWKFLENAHGMWNYISTEKGTHKKVGGHWEWDKLEHLTHGRNGTVLVATITVENVIFQPTIGIYNSGCTLYFNYSSSFICKGIPGNVSLSTNVNSPVWNVDN